MMKFPLCRRVRTASVTRAFLVLSFCSAMITTAAPVVIGDHSFEANDLAAGGWSNNLFPEWEESGGAGNGGTFEEYIVGFSAEGTDHLGMTDGFDVWQDLGVSYEANTLYTLTVGVGHRPGQSNPGNSSTYILADNLGTIYATGSLDSSTIPSGSFEDGPELVFDTASNPAAVGKTIRILLRSLGNGRSHFDNIRLDATSTQAPGAAEIQMLAATDLTTTTATLNAEVTDVGDGAPTVTFYYGTVNGGLVPGAWEFSVNPGGTHNGAVSAGVTGLSAATTYHATALATNSAGDSWALPVIDFETMANPPVVANVAASAMTATTAVIGAEVVSSGGDNPNVEIYYGTTDGGTDAGSWDGSVSLGIVSGQATTLLSGLVSGTPYFFRAFATNSGGSVWAPDSAVFATSVVTVADISNRNPNGITGSTASLRGEVDGTGGDVPQVTIFYGTADGVTDPGAWEFSIDLGLQSGAFSFFVGGLSSNTEYFYRCRAQNGAGTAWAADTRQFQTSNPVAGSLIINEIHYDPEDESTPGEFVELYNPGDAAIDVSGWRLSDGVDFTIPGGTVVAAGGYLVIAQDPATILSKHGAVALGPWVGRLNNDGEQVDLRDESDVLQDQVTYGVGFPWPTGSRGTGGSAELIHPALDNELGGSWRTSGVSTEPATYYLTANDPQWRYRKGTSEASSPIGDWRQLSFSEDGTWATGQTSIGYGDNDDNTILGDMRNGYTTVYLRKTFTLPPGDIPNELTLRIYVDDGAVVWINGQEVARVHAPAGELPYNATGINHDAAWEEVEINNASTFLVGGTNVLAIHALNTTLGSSDFSIDAELVDRSTSGSSDPSPGIRNRSYSTTSPPQIRQVGHSPETPMTGDEVIITAKITDPDGVGPVSLDYQLVDPGSYIRRSDASYATDWTTVPMLDDGSNGDAVAGDSIFTAVMPSGLQTHRRLVRYRITFEDGNGLGGTVPWPDDEQPNFAYFVHDGSASWTGSFTPGGPESTFSPALMDELPTYHLVAQEGDVLASQYSGGSDGVHMFGTLVYDGEVYDHIEFENRGEASTYVSGKNKWRFHFNRARSFKARDDLGRRYESDWNKMNFQGCSSPWAAVHRGMAGVEEAVSYRLYELCDVPSPRTHYAHFRVVDESGEVDAGNQYEGDLWGLYLAVEQPDGSFLNDRGLPDGNVYKIEGGGGDKKEQGIGQPVDSSDWNEFRNLSNSTRDEQWWRDNHDMETYYSFRAAHRICGNVDIRLGYNHYYYHHPDGRWVPMPWDLDMMFIAETHQAGYIQQQASLNSPNVGLQLEFRNRCRELVDLMCSDGSPDGGQIGQLIDQYEQIVNPAGQELTWANLDAYMWNYHPRTNGNPNSHGGQSSHKGNFHYPTYSDSRIGGGWTRTLVSADHEGSMNYLREYATDTFTGGSWTRGNGQQKGYGYEYLSQEAEEPDPDKQPPFRPTLSFSGTAGFPVNDLRFDSSVFDDPDGSGTFEAMRWRIAEIASPGVPGYVAGEPRKYEIDALWDSGELNVFSPTVQIPVAVTEPGHTYRVRVRHKDDAGRWSHWSDAIEFVASVADVGVWQGNLVVTELMYHPPEPTGSELAVSADKDDYEYIELWNASDTLSLDLTDLQMADGVTFSFSAGAITTLGPGEYVLLVSNQPAFEARYGTGLPVAGEYSGNFSNSGEQVVLSLGVGSPILDFTYTDITPWPSGADGFGPAMVLVDPVSIPDHSLPESWMAGALDGGSPGSAETPEPGSFAAWRLETFTPAELADPEISGVNADYDGDSRSTLLEWALATDPLTADSPELEFTWVTNGEQSYPAIRFHRPEGTVGVVYELLAGDDLETWNVEPVSPVSDGTLGDGFEKALLIDDDPESGDARYLRIQIRLEN